MLWGLRGLLIPSEQHCVEECFEGPSLSKGPGIVQDRHGDNLIYSEYAMSPGREAGQNCPPGRLEKIAQRLRLLATLAEDLGFVPSTHMASHNHLQLGGSNDLFWPPRACA